jgi:hypothetical protein
MMEFPWPKWMEFFVLGISFALCLITLKVVDRFQKRRWARSIGESEKQNEQEVPLTAEDALTQTA